MRSPLVGRSVLVCFVVGRVGVPAAELAAVEAEAARHRDVLWLPTTGDGCYLTASKVHDFWRAAARWLTKPAGGGGVAPTRLAHVAKVDEDSFVSLSLLVAELRRLACVPHLYYGSGAWAGYHPTKYTMCGFSWRGERAYRRYGCALAGALPPFPFVMGGVQVLSA